jgi:hypothetical protein
MQAKTLVRRNFFTSLTSPPIIGAAPASDEGDARRLLDRSQRVCVGSYQKVPQEPSMTRLFPPEADYLGRIHAQLEHLVNTNAGAMFLKGPRLTPEQR